MSVSYRLISANDLDPTLIETWRLIQSTNAILESPYFCPEFTLITAGVRDDVRIVIIDDGKRPVGFFPHQRSMLGMGKPIGGPLSDYHGIIVNPESKWELDAIMRTANLSVWAFDHLAGDTRAFETHVTALATSPQIDLSAGYDQYVRGRRDAGSSYISKTEGLARKLGREIGELQFTLHDPGSETIQQIIRWKRDQYRQVGTTDVFGVSWTGELLRRIAFSQSTEFAGVCSVLRAGDRMVAAHIGMRSRRTLHYWFPAYDPEFAKYSTGIILLLRMAQALTEIGVRTIDLGKGDAQYKQRLMTGAVELREGYVERPSLIAGMRQMRRVAEAHAARGGMAAALRLPLRAMRRLERSRTFR